MRGVVQAVAALAAGVAAGFFARPESGATEDIVRTRGISIVDGQGKERMWLGKPRGEEVSDEVVGLSILSPTGQEAVWIGSYITGGGAALQIRDAAGKVRIALTTYRGPSIIVDDEKGVARIDLSAEDGKDAVISMRDDSGADRLTMSVGGRAAAGVGLQLSHRLKADDAILSTLQRGGVTLRTLDDGRSSLAMQSYDGEVIWKAP